MEDSDSLDKIHIRFQKLWQQLLPESVRLNSKDWINVLDCCYENRKILIGSEQGYVLVHDMENGVNLREHQIQEPWVSSIDLLKGYLWISAQKRSLKCLNYGSMQQIFLVNTHTNFGQYSGKGVKLVRTEKGRFMVFNSKYSSLRILSPHRRKILTRFRLLERITAMGTQEYMQCYGVDEINKTVWFNYNMDTRMYIYSFVTRKILTVQSIYHHDFKLFGKICPPPKNLFSRLLVENSTFLI